MKHFKKIKFPFIENLHIKDLLKGGLSSFLLRILGMVVSYLFTYSITKLYGAEILGKYALSFTIVQMVAIFFSLGLPLAIVKLTATKKYFSGDNFKSNYFYKSLKILLFSSIIGTIIMVVAAPHINDVIFKQKNLDFYLFTMSLAIVGIIGTQLIAEFFRAQRQIVVFGILVYVLPFLLPLLIILYGSVTLNLISPSEAFLYGTLMVFAIGLILLIIKLRKTKLAPNSENISYKNLFNLSLPMLMTSALIFVLAWTDTIMLSYLTSSKDVGVYNVVIKISNLTILFIVAINNIAAPKIAQLHSEGKMPEFILLVVNSTKVIFYTTLPILILLMFFSEELLELFGNEFIIGKNALIILLAGKFINAISGSVGQVLNMTGHQKVFSNITIIMILLNVLLNYLLIPRYGIYGAATASMISSVLINVACVVYIKLKFGFYTFYLPLINTTK